SPVGVEPVLQQDPVQPRYLALEIAQEVDLEAVLRFVLLERVGVVDADPEHRHVTGGKLVVVVPHLAELGGACAGERQGKEGKDDGAPAERREGDFLPRRGWKGKVGSLLAYAGRGLLDGGGHATKSTRARAKG